MTNKKYIQVAKIKSDKVRNTYNNLVNIYRYSYRYLFFIFFVFCITFSLRNFDVYGSPISKKAYTKSSVVVKSVEYCEDGIKVKWNKIPKTKGYYIYRKEDDGQWEIYDVVGKKRKYIDTCLETGTKYQYAVQGYANYKGKIIKSKITESGQTLIGLPDKVEGLTAKYVGVTQAKLKWKASEEASGYQIYRQIGNEEWEKIAEIKNPDICKYTDNIIECKKTYKYKVIPYEIVEDILYDGYMNVTGSYAYADTGIDVSYHNGKIKWSKVRADGVDFAFIRIGRGEPKNKSGAVLDEKFDRNIRNARKYGVKVGVYFYSCARSVEQAEKEAKFVVKKLKNYGELDYPVVYDFESMYRRGFKYKKKNTKMIQAFCDIIAEAGYETMVYSDYEMLSKYTDYDKISKYGTWVAYWTYDTDRYPVDLDNVLIWQYSDVGRFDGIKTYTDKNVRFVN